MTALFRSPYMWLALTTLIWGGNAVAGKFAVGHISPMVLTLMRWGIALAIIGFIAKDRVREDWPTIKANWFYLLAMGGIGYTLFNFALYSALQTISAINVTLYQSAMPVVIFVVNLILYRIGIRWLQVVGYLLTLVGVAVTVTGGDPMALFSGEGAGWAAGDLFMLIAALAYGGYSAVLRSKPKMHWQSFLTALVAAALLFAMVGAAIEHSQGAALWPVTLQGWLVAFYAGIFPSLVSQGLFIKGVEALGANLAGLFINMVPVWGAILSVLLLGEGLYLYHAVAFALVVTGITIAQRKAA
ncbi:DMT family transporter [Ahrensia sp. R2A130]|uniref:DMT family transporter n=1 Tax=Ahrensia sp. R2A130 TaxID=744979 RepID=UPI0001E0ACC4|nr:DMT family transporter [Ahrensia sp. R2A130]EFL88691.1 DMT family permease [Ahrensia sp. R2A130]